MFNPYPEETRWREILPEQSPLCILEYGLMTELIVPLIIKYRLKNKKTIICEFSGDFHGIIELTKKE